MQSWKKWKNGHCSQISFLPHTKWINACQENRNMHCTRISYWIKNCTRWFLHWGSSKKYNYIYSKKATFKLSDYGHGFWLLRDKIAKGGIIIYNYSERSKVHFGWHFLYCLFFSWEKPEPIQADIGWEAAYSLHRLLMHRRANTHRDKQAFTPTDNLESPINLTPIWVPAEISRKYRENMHTHAERPRPYWKALSTTPLCHTGQET